MIAATGHSEKRYFYDRKDDFPLSVLMFHPVWVKIVYNFYKSGISINGLFIMKGTP
jgi:hypothetical protein